MTYYTYIIYSSSQQQFYRGITGDLSDRLSRHNNGNEVSTKHGVPWVLMWRASKASRGEAQRLERKLKNLSRERLVKFMKDYPEGIIGPDADQVLDQWSGF